jgi:hypothetical protein
LTAGQQNTDRVAHQRHESSWPWPFGTPFYQHGAGLPQVSSGKARGENGGIPDTEEPKLLHLHGWSGRMIQI